MAFTPVNLEVNEFEGTSFTITMSANTSAPEPANTETFIINNVELLTKSHDPGDLNITLKDNTFTITSRFADVFERTIKYIIQNTKTWEKTYGTAGRFADLPYEYTALIHYIPPSVEFYELDFKVDATGSVSGDVSEIWTLVVRYNNTISNANLMEYAKKSIMNSKASELYPELLE